jgi:hypothetical protein
MISGSRPLIEPHFCRPEPQQVLHNRDIAAYTHASSAARASAIIPAAKGRA